MEFPEGYYTIKDSMAELAKNEEAFAIVAKAVKLVTNFTALATMAKADVYKRQVMNWINELSWLWETLGIALIAAAVCVACAALRCV